MSKSFLCELEAAHPSLTMWRKTMSEEDEARQMQDDQEREQQLEEALTLVWTECTREAIPYLRTICRECGIDPKRIIGE